MLDLKFFLEEGPEVRDMYREHIFGKAKDVHGKPFKSYSQDYGKAKRSGKLKRQATKYANSKAPVLTGDTMRDFKVLNIGHGFKLGWTSFGGTVLRLEKMGRELSTSRQPLPENILDYLDKQIDKNIKKALGKSKTVHLKI